MQSKTKIIIGLAIFCPAFLYFLLTTGNGPSAASIYIVEDDIVLRRQLVPPQLRKEVLDLADSYNQNIQGMEVNGLMINRPSTI